MCREMSESIKNSDDLCLSFCVILIFYNEWITFISRSNKDVFFWNKNLNRIIVSSYTEFSLNLHITACTVWLSLSPHTQRHTYSGKPFAITCHKSLLWLMLNDIMKNFPFFFSHNHQYKIIKRLLLWRGGANLILRKKNETIILSTNYINLINFLHFSPCSKNCFNCSAY